jgi:endonuclease/exonuclease/phosphatase family metal-dependent hydrolase
MLLYGTINDWQPEERTVLSESPTPTQLDSAGSLRILIWNLGYAGLGQESDFFYDQGGFFVARTGHIRMDRPYVEKNLRGITDFVARSDADFLLFQEIDSSSRRSYYLNQLAAMREVRPGFQQNFAANYRVKHVPIPLFEPWHQYGRVHSGLASYTRSVPATSVRRSLPGAFAWPTRLFQLDRCILLQRFPIADGKTLVLINLHLSAYDKDGAIKKEQLNFLRELAVAEYQRGHYVILGGDWNMCPPGFDCDSFYRPGGERKPQANIDADLFPADWTYAFDPGVPSNRKTNRPYDPAVNFRTIIDFYLVSPNVQVQEVTGVDLDFAFSDHQPVLLRVALD